MIRATSSSPPQVSIGLPVYNGEAFLETALRSLMQQSYPDLEIIVADNHSSDATPAICDRLTKEDPRIRVIRHAANLGATANYNFVVAIARGSYFKWAAHDDICHPDFISQCMDVLQHDAAVGLCYPSTFVINTMGEILSEYRDGIHLMDADPALRLRAYLRQNFLRQQGMCNPIFGLYRMELLRKTRLIQNFIGSDRMLIAHIAMMGKVFELPDHLFQRRVHLATSTMANRSFTGLLDWYAGAQSIKNKSKHSHDNFLALRFRQVFDLYRAAGESFDDAADRRHCRAMLVMEMLRDPKWLYKDVKYSLGFRPTPSSILRSLGGR